MVNGLPRETESPLGVAKIIELVGTSRQSFDDAVRAAAQEAAKTLEGLRGSRSRA